MTEDVTSVAVPDRWRLRIPASATAPRRVRAGLSRWLAGLGWPEERAADIVLAVDEAVGNAAEHAYALGVPAAADVPSDRSGIDDVASAEATGEAPSVEAIIDVEVPAEVEVTGEVERLDGGERRLRLCVRDWGRWRPKPLDPGARGRGLDLMVGLMAHITLRPGDPGSTDAPVGTEVILISQAVGTPPSGGGAPVAAD